MLRCSTLTENNCIRHVMFPVMFHLTKINQSLFSLASWFCIAPPLIIHFDQLDCWLWKFAHCEYYHFTWNINALSNVYKRRIRRLKFSWINAMENLGGKFLTRFLFPSERRYSFGGGLWTGSIKTRLIKLLIK